ncbi:MAG: response regulator [Spirulina sp. DLM2.Bin59]|nr:MAG: response regulator [Spirulina sp. DLM2.Bin59]
MAVLRQGEGSRPPAEQLISMKTEALETLTKQELIRCIQALKQTGHDSEQSRRCRAAYDRIADLEQQLQQKNHQLANYIRQIDTLTAAVAAVEEGQFTTQGLQAMGDRPDELGELARCFQQMIGNLKSREQQLAEAKEQLAAVLNAVPGTIAWISAKGHYIGVNRHLADIVNLDPKDFEGRELGFLNSSSDFTQFINAFLRSPASSLTTELPIPVRGELFHYMLVAQKYHQGEAMVLVGIDITEKQQYFNHLEQRVAERTLELAIEKERAEVANQAKSTFIANMSHELRSPLNAILGFAQLMMRSPHLDPEQLENVTIINRSGEHLLNLINHVLDLSKIEAGKTALAPKDFDLYRLLDDLEDMFHLRAESQNLQLICDCSPQVPRYIRTDEVKLRQVLINLLNNAIKFTKIGGVSVQIESEAPQGDRQAITFSVSDTGVGIAPEELTQIFEAFGQTQVGQQYQEGTGLGLPISQKFVQLMQGEIEVESQVGVGSRFYFTIPVKVVDRQSIPEARTPQRRVLALAPNQPQYRILVVDDQESNRRLLRKLLASLGFEVKEAENGRAAIALWEDWQPHLIWMDMRMPIMDGYEATRQIKSTTQGQATAIIALTASVLEEEKTVVLSAGCDDFIRKPFLEDTIFETMTRHLGVQYIYADNQALSAETMMPPLTQELFAAMPIPWQTQLYQAATDCDDEHLHQLIADIPPSQSELIHALTHRVNNYRMDEICEALLSLPNFS